jgi:enamine deaminase RidA (YjgF/YER057c/UK114 family)
LKLLVKNIEKTLEDIGIDIDCLNRTSIAHEKEQDFTESFCMLRRIITGMKRMLTAWEKNSCH